MLSSMILVDFELFFWRVYKSHEIILILIQVEVELIFIREVEHAFIVNSKLAVLLLSFVCHGFEKMRALVYYLGSVVL